MPSFDPTAANRARLQADAVRAMNKLPYGVEGLLLNILRNEGTRQVFFKSCLTCRHFVNYEPDKYGIVTYTWPASIPHEKRNDSNRWLNETCTLANARPPARVIANACSQYEDEDIPF